MLHMKGKTPLDSDGPDELDVRYKVLGTTSGGKDIVVYPSNDGCYRIRFLQGGELPKRLKGRFTRYSEAAIAVNIHMHYEDVKKDKKTKSPKTFKNTNTTTQDREQIPCQEQNIE